MRAWQVEEHGEPSEVLGIVEREQPEPGPGELRVRVSAMALGLPDVFMCRGTYPLTPELPFTPGQELAGVVTAAGKGSCAQPGERVMAVAAFYTGRGGFAEEALVIDDFAFPAPDSMTDEEAAAFVIPFHTAHVGLVRRARLREGEALLVLGGAGGVGSAAIQLGRAFGARVLATAAGPRKAAFCRELGAAVVIDYCCQDIATEVLEATDGRGADVVYDPVGGDAFDAAVKCIAHEGRLLTVGFASGRWSNPSSSDLTLRNYSVVGVFPGGYRREFRLEAQEELLALHHRGQIRVPVDRVLPFDALPGALEDLAAGRVRGKTVLRL